MLSIKDKLILFGLLVGVIVAGIGLGLAGWALQVWVAKQIWFG